MSISTLFYKLKGVALTAGLCLGLGLTIVPAQAAEKVASLPGPTEKTRARGIAEIPAILTEAQLPCEVADAYFIGESSLTGADKKKSKLVVYEVACKSGIGYIIDKNLNNNQINNRNCTQAATQNAVNPSDAKCLLPANATHHTWLKPTAQIVDQSCVVTQAQWLGTVMDRKFDRYEVTCEGASGLVLDVPLPGSEVPAGGLSCLVSGSRGQACKLTPAETVIQSASALTKAAQPNCQLNNARWVGRVSSSDEDIYEIGCANQPGFIAITDTNMKFKTLVGCDRAGSLGPCQYTDAAVLTDATKTNYTETLKNAGVNCTVADYNVVGTDSVKRDLVEFKCAEQAFGMNAFVPSAGSTAKLEAFDCYALMARKRACDYVTREFLDKNIDAVAKAAGKDCDVKEVRYAARSDNDGVIIEIACTNKRGYIADLQKDRKGFLDIVSCSIAKSRDYINCEIPGNGTYVSTVGADS